MLFLLQQEYKVFDEIANNDVKARMTVLADKNMF